MKLEARGLKRIGLALHCAKAAVFEQLDSGEGRAEQNVERFPPAGFAQGRTEPFGRVAQKSDNWHPCKQAALEKDEPGVQMANDGSFDLVQLWADYLVLREKRQR